MHLAAHDDVAKRAVVNKSKLGTASLQVGASGFLCCARDFYGEDDGEEDAIVWRADGVVEEIVTEVVFFTIFTGRRLLHHIGECREMRLVWKP